MSGLCPFVGQTEYVSAAQCDAYDAQAQINRRSVAIPSARKAEGRRFDPGPGHPLLPAAPRLRNRRRDGFPFRFFADVPSIGLAC